MKILLVRTKPDNLFNRLGLVTFEPLELEYLAAAAKELQQDVLIYDGQVEQLPFDKYLKQCNPDLVAITGYTIDVNRIRRYAGIVKAYRSDLPVVVGGVHAELNWQDFCNPAIDAIVHANPVVAFKAIICAFEQDLSLEKLENICVRTRQGNEWVKNPGQPLDPNQLPLPDRTHLLTHKKAFRYFGQEECALVKTAWGCPFECSFCYCSCLNQGHYTCREIEKVMAELQSLPQKKIFIIDDTFLLDKKRIEVFCRLVREYGIQKSFSVYSRADFIIAHEALLVLLKEAGIDEIIIGLETMDERTLSSYKKGTTAADNYQAVELLRQYKINSTVLFIVGNDYSKEDFSRLRRTVRQLNPDLCMFSVFTPLKGVPEYKQYLHKLAVAEDNFEAYDFLHLTMTPTNITTMRFYLEFYLLYASFYLSFGQLKRNAGPIARSLFSLLKEAPKGLWDKLKKFAALNFPDIWDVWAHRYDKLWVQKYSLSPSRKLILSELEKKLTNAIHQEISILDVGCGTGQLLQDIVTAFKDLPLHAVGIDSSWQMVRAAQEKQIPQTQFLYGDAQNLPFPDASFDILTCSHSFPYYADKTRAIAEFGRVLKPGGVLLLVNASVNNLYDKLVMTMVKLTTSPAHYPSAAETTVLVKNGGLIPLGQQPLATAFYMPSIILTCAQRGT